GSFAFPMICTFALVVIMVLGNGRTGLISMATRSWAATGYARWSAGVGGLGASPISSGSAPAVVAAAASRPSRACGARAWGDGGGNQRVSRDEGRVSRGNSNQ